MKLRGVRRDKQYLVLLSSSPLAVCINSDPVAMARGVRAARLQFRYGRGLFCTDRAARLRRYTCTHAFGVSSSSHRRRSGSIACSGAVATNLNAAVLQILQPSGCCPQCVQVCAFFCVARSTGLLHMQDQAMHGST